MVRQSSMAVGPCGRGSSSHGGQETERRERMGTRSNLQGHTASGLLPPTRPLLLKFPSSPKTTLAAGDQVLSTWTWGNIFYSNHNTPSSPNSVIMLTSPSPCSFCFRFIGLLTPERAIICYFLCSQGPFSR
jgi:hypothetical protein